MTDIDGVLAQVGSRLRRLRRERRITLTAAADATGISVSTLSRLESGSRRATLELLLPLARLYQVPLDDLVGAPPVGDPRVCAEPKTMNGMTAIPLTRQPGQPQAFKLVVPPRPEGPDPRVHEGYEWMYVLSGRLRLVLADHDIVLGPGEAAEFDTRHPHWFAAAGDQPAEILSLFGKQGERAHLRARAK
ncbi:XRE family transcriptional regulator [Prauserella shujinwangii]|uniref:XRE family transcriptional regulator n=1 Tax=Prauserella shujinwangii TaxID=1453103 RepID=A0A2T0M039_9PSEU|nr:XRE family transcriptional regulator [Prauserella shujinwangii]PRX49952.1 XRE family transcriptional regulator [Prauserella shujinwangii]